MSDREAISETVSLKTVDRITIAIADNPPVNALSHSVRTGLVAAVDRLEKDDGLDALVVICEGKSFFSGADIKEFGKPMGEPHLGEVAARLEGANKPVIAAIHGKALGGGLEVAMACHYRVALTNAAIGLPEVKLGIIPGCGGTQRLPRLIGLERTLAMVTEGGNISAGEARDLGAIDATAEAGLLDAAIAFAKDIVAKGAAIRRVRDLPMPPEDAEAFARARATMAKKKRGLDAPQKAIDAVELAYRHPFDEALAQENAICRELLTGAQSRALRHNFAAERAVMQLPFLSDAAERNVETVAVLGLGVMGAGIVTVFANAGYSVIAIERTQEKLDRAMVNIAKSYDGMVKRGKLTEAQAEERLGRVTPTLDLERAVDAQLVIEAIREEMPIKREAFEKLGRITRPGAILASNTSYLDIDALAVASGRPEDVCGMHFFNPPHAMRLLENVRGARTSPDVLATITAVAKRIGKLPVLSGVSDGFIVNRMLSKRSREGFFMLEEGATPDQIDRVIGGFGFPMGPYALADLAGLDVQHAARQARWDRLTEREKAANFVDQLYARGRYGQKSGAGWYRYGEDRKPQADPEIATLLAEHAAARGIAKRDIGDQEVLERCLFAMVNEGAMILDEGIVARPEDVDVAMVNGIGFPAHTGGPLWWAGEIGLAKVRERILHYRDIAGAEYWTPSPLLDRLADEGRTFYDR